MLFCTVAEDSDICSNFLFLACGFDKANLNEVNTSSDNTSYDYYYHFQTRIPVYASHSPAGTSVRNLAHWAQVCWMQ